MALVTTGLFMRVTLADAGGNRSTLNFQLNPATADFVDLSTMGGAPALARVADIVAKLQVVSAARVISYSIGEGFTEDTNLFGAAGSEVEKIASIVAPIDGALNKKGNVRIPSPADGIFVGDGVPGPEKNNVDVTDADLLAWMQRFQASISNVDPYTGDFLISDGESLQDVTSGNIKGKQIHRASTYG